MSTAAHTIEKQVKAFCARIGSDRLLVQGAGGNVSWKEGDVLWVKASGTWLSEAESREIFVPVNLGHLQSALAQQDFSLNPVVVGSSDLRPSIETLLHALMPHNVVVHLHAVEILTHLVQVNARDKIEKLVGDSVKWIFIDYFKPGADLARAVSEELSSRPDADVVFMSNHGVVIAGGSVDDVAATLYTLTSKLQSKLSLPLPKTSSETRQSDFMARGYALCPDEEVRLLATKDQLINRIRHEWALYPDHVVFLGPKANILERNFKIQALDESVLCRPPFIIAAGDGVYESTAATPAQKIQLRCYFDIVARQNGEEKLSTLNDLQISELLDWEAEKYRQVLVNRVKAAT